MVAEYYYNPNTNKTFTKDSAQKIESIQNKLDLIVNIE